MRQMHYSRPGLVVDRGFHSRFVAGVAVLEVEGSAVGGLWIHVAVRDDEGEENWPALGCHM